MFEIFNIIFTTVGQFFMAFIKLVPTFMELKNIPVNIMAVTLGLPAIVISIGFMVIKIIKHIELI